MCACVVSFRVASRLQFVGNIETYSRRLLAEQADGNIAQRRMDQDSLRNVIEISWNGSLSSRDLRFAVWQRCESRCLAAAVAHDFFSGACGLGLKFFFPGVDMDQMMDYLFRLES